MLSTGSLAIAIVQRQIMLVQAAKSHSQKDQWLHVYIYEPFGECIFITHQTPILARIASKDLLTIFPSSEPIRQRGQGMVELPFQAYLEFLELSSRNQRKMDSLWGQWKARAMRRSHMH